MTSSARYLTLLCAALMLGLGVGCDLEGKVVLDAPLTLGDQVPTIVGDTGGDDGGGGGGPLPPPGGGGGGGDGAAEPFDGTWIVGYSDNLAVGGAIQSYGVRIVLDQEGGAITGTGRMLRFFQTGAVANDFPAFDIVVSGTATGDSATLTLASAVNNAFDNNPVWNVRVVGNRLIGIYAEKDPFSGDVQRLGFSVWHRWLSSNFSAEFVSGYMDAGVNVDGVQTLTNEHVSRTGRVSLAQGGLALTGGGTLVEQMSGPLTSFTDFAITTGQLDGPLAGVTFGNLVDQAVGPVAGNIDWILLSNGDVMVGAYGEFNASDGLVRLGHATWRRSPTVEPNDINATWVTAFEDTHADGSNNEFNYLATVTLSAGEGGVVTGSARVLDETDVNPMLQNYTVENGNILGSEVVFDLVSAGGERFSWNCRLAGSVLVGSYQHTDNGGNFISHGKSEWRNGSSTGLTGVWIASYFDTFTASAVENRTSQLARVDITDATIGGSLIGAGTVRLASETGPRFFTVSGDVTSTIVHMIWSGGDLFGDTEWNLRKAGNYLFGTYTNFDSGGVIEFQGFAVFERSTL
jgi:hypothetical protein